jgi:hypothetical protein
VKANFPIYTRGKILDDTYKRPGQVPMLTFLKIQQDMRKSALLILLCVIFSQCLCINRLVDQEINLSISLVPSIDWLQGME